MRWELIFRKPKFRNLPIGFRKHKVNRLSRMSEIVNVNESDEEIERDDLKFKRRTMVNDGLNYTQQIATKISRMALQNKDWYSYLKTLYK